MLQVAGIAGRHCRKSPAAQNGWGDGGTRAANKLCQVFRRPVVKGRSHSLNPPTSGLPAPPHLAAPRLAAPHLLGPFSAVPRNGAMPGFDLSKPARRIKGNTCFDPGSRLAVFGRLFRSDNSGHAGLVHKIAAGQVPSDGCAAWESGREALE